MPFAGGATIAVLVPGTILGSPVTLALGGVTDRIKKNFDKYLGALRNAARSIPTEPDFDRPIHIEL